MLYFVFAGLAAMLDQMFKLWIGSMVPANTRVILIPGVLNLTNIQNTGAAFSMLENHKWAVTALSAVGVLLLCYLLYMYRGRSVMQFALSGVLGGGLGNLLDRLLRGSVTDMFEFAFVKFAIFNVADCFIVVGGIAFVLLLLLDMRAKPHVHEFDDDDEHEHDNEDDDAPEVAPDVEPEKPVKPVKAAKRAKPIKRAKRVVEAETEDDYAPPEADGDDEITEFRILEEYHYEQMMREFDSKLYDDNDSDPE
ncbi:MAG: signal peptidase II [Oscillospiraceae bacterium]|jgi:signal peptidase II|nr:signal peptidase II [Oscillospiraceae bacterium]